MTRISARRAFLLGVTLVAGGCDKRADTPSTVSPAPAQALATDSPAQAMADMPGMARAVPGAIDSGAARPSQVTFTAAQIQHGGVQWGPVAMAPAVGTATVPGELTPNEDRTVRLGAPARGRVLSVAVRPGDRVSAGASLVTLQSPEAGMAQADVAKAEAEVTSRRSEAQYATSARARADRLLVLKAIPRQEYERAIADDDHARTALAQAEAEAQRARTTAQQLGAAGTAAGEMVVRAPAAGVVLARDATPGAVVDAGAPLVVITDPSTLWLTIAASEPVSALFHRGGQLRFTVPAYPADTFAARVDAVGAGLDPATRTLGVRAIIANAGNRLKPQMFTTVIVDGAASGSAADVPDEAVQLIQGKPCVFLVSTAANGAAQFTRRDVVIGARRNGRVAVLAGVRAGDLVVTSGAFAVKAALEKGTMPKMEM